MRYPGEVTEEPAWMEDFEALFGTLGSVPAFVGQLQGAVLDVINRAVEEEREECAKILDREVEQAIVDYETTPRVEWLKRLAAEIRARGEGIAVA